MTLNKLKHRLAPSISMDGVKAIVWYNEVERWRFKVYIYPNVDIGHIVRKYTTLFDDISDEKLLFEATREEFDKNSLGKGTLVFQEGAGTKNLWYTDMR